MNIALILISGKGKRMESDIPKQFLPVLNKPLYLYTLNTFYLDKKIDRILLVTNYDYREKVENDLVKYGYIDKPIEVISGGEERYLSVKKAIDALDKYHDDDKILIHDGVRANISEKIIDDNIASLDTNTCVLTAIKAPNDYNPSQRVDTIHVFDKQKYRAQTPQSFRLKVLKDIYNNIAHYESFPFTDDISLAIAANYPYAIVEGEENNYKITHREDLDRFIQELLKKTH